VSVTGGASGDDNALDAEIVPGGDEGGKSDIGGSMTFLEQIDQAGLKLKPMALEAKERSSGFPEDRPKRILYTLKSCTLFTSFMMFRAYRGFFVLLPAVFMRVYEQMEKSVYAPFVEEDELNKESRDVDPVTGKVRFRTRFTVSILSAFVTASYVVAGLWKVFVKFVGSLTSTSSFEDSFEAAADEVLKTEDKIKKITDQKKID